MAKKELSAEAVVADIRAQMDDAALLAKYELTSAQLNTVFKELMAGGFITEEEISTLTSLGHLQPRLTGQGSNPEPVSTRDAQETYSNAENPESKVWKSITIIHRISSTTTILATNVLRSLRNTDRPVRSYVWRAWLISIIPTYVIGSIVVGVLALPSPTIPDSSPVFLVIFLLYIAPVVETMVMWPILWILRAVMRRQLRVALASAVIWGVLHGLHSVAQGLTITWAFFVFSICFMEWEKKSKLTGIGVTALLHMTHNLVPACALIVIALSGGTPIEHKSVPSPVPPAQREAASISVDREVASTKPSITTMIPVKIREMGKEDEYKRLIQAFSKFGEEEFLQANADLYPDWKKNHAPGATWEEFLVVYKEFVKWWTNSGSPPERGFKLWKDFLAQRR